MQTLRQTRFLVRLVLAWFVLSVGIATASPLIVPQNVQLVCSGAGGMKLLLTGEDGPAGAVHHTLDCPLCVPVAPAPQSAGVKSAIPLKQPLPTVAAYERLSVRIQAVPPARGPPVLLPTL